ncbi:MAG TPA: pilus assembly PilX N-terminal domain-containing protein [Nitrospinota bacterium]|nr:pilus assembly PilX N-terminal domain-containing protein [Nitrospinota bacterium]
MKRSSYHIAKKFTLRVLKQKRGVALIASMMIMAALTILGLWAVTSSLIDNQITSNYRDHIQAFYNAEAGIEHAVNILKASTTSLDDLLLGSDGVPNTSDDGILSLGPSISFGSGAYEVRVKDNDDGDGDLFSDSDKMIVLASRGRVNNSNAVKTIGVGIKPAYIFNMGIFADERITISSNAKTDSYDSKLGVYGGSNIGSKGDVGTNGTSTSPAAVSLSSNAKIYGDAFIGEGGDPSSAISLSSNAEITGEKTAINEPVELPLMSAPSGLPSMGSISLSSNDQQIISGSGSYSSITLSSNSQLTIGGSGEVVISTGTLSLNSNTQLNVGSGVTSVTIFVSDSLSVSSNAKINSNTKDPTKMNIFGTDSLTNCSLSSNGGYFGTLYARNSDITVSSNVEIHGALIANRITLNSNARIHYDESLGRTGPSSGLMVSSWREEF